MFLPPSAALLRVTCWASSSRLYWSACLIKANSDGHSSADAMLKIVYQLLLPFVAGRNHATVFTGMDHQTCERVKNGRSELDSAGGVRGVQ
jgi:predicted Na+-dependent transporter